MPRAATSPGFALWRQSRPSFLVEKKPHQAFRVSGFIGVQSPGASALQGNSHDNSYWICGYSYNKKHGTAGRPLGKSKFTVKIPQKRADGRFYPQSTLISRVSSGATRRTGEQHREAPTDAAKFLQKIWVLIFRVSQGQFSALKL